MMSRWPHFLCLNLLASFLLVTLAQPSPLAAEEPAPPSAPDGTLLDELDRATGRVSNDSYLLRYKFELAEPMLTKVVQLVSMQTRIDGVDQTVQSRSQSWRQWDVKQVDADGNITLVHTITQVRMWQKVSGKDEIRYDSSKDDMAPGTYQAIADSVGKPLSTVTITPQGTVVKRVDSTKQFNPGIDSLLIPLPEKAVKVGQRWYTPQKLRIRTTEGVFRTIQLRRQYQLEKVEAGVATIAIKTQVLTPLTDPKIKSQLVQRLQDGSVLFDIAGGQVRTRRMQLDQRVIGFNGPTSMMHYLARLTEEKVDRPAPPELKED
jgi:hypothetical protein